MQCLAHELISFYKTRGKYAVLCVLTLRTILRLGFAREVRRLGVRTLPTSVLTRNRVTVIDASVGHVVATLRIQNVFELGFSPFGTFIITWQRPSKEENGDAVKNLTVWRVVGGDSFAGHSKHMIVGRFVQKSASGWNLQYTQDERFCARIVTNEVHVYESADLATVWNKVRVEGVTNFAISPGEDHTIAVFVPERKVGSTAETTDSVSDNRRAYQQLSKSFAFPISMRRYYRRTFLEATRSS